MRKWLIIIGSILNVICIIAVAICVFSLLSLEDALLTQKAAGVWRGDGELRFAQVSAFFRADEPTTVGAIDALRAKVATSLTSSSLEAPKGGSLFTDAYSARGRVTLSLGKDEASVAAYGIGGDFFLFHPLELLSGSYIGGDDLMRDRIVIDEAIAWRFFGSSDVAGMEITVNGSVFLIAGVVRAEADKYTQRVIGDEPFVFVDYSVLSADSLPAPNAPSADVDGSTPIFSSAGINCYEIVMPNQITGYAAGIVREGFPSESVDIVENSARYGSESINRLLGNIGTRSADNTGILYPYWENAARLSEDYAAVYTVTRNAFLVLPLLTLAFLAVLAIRAVYIRRALILGKIRGLFADAIDRRRTRKFERVQSGVKSRRAQKRIKNR